MLNCDVGVGPTRLRMKHTLIGVCLAIAATDRFIDRWTEHGTDTRGTLIEIWDTLSVIGTLETNATCENNREEPYKMSGLSGCNNYDSH